jgi:hypothetical protein
VVRACTTFYLELYEELREELPEVPDHRIFALQLLTDRGEGLLRPPLIPLMSSDVEIC